jgi:hypothetical protein
VVAAGGVELGQEAGSVLDERQDVRADGHVGPLDLDILPTTGDGGDVGLPGPPGGTAQQGAHGRAGVHGDHVGDSWREGKGEASGAGTDVEHGGPSSGDSTHPGEQRVAWGRPGGAGGEAASSGVPVVSPHGAASRNQTVHFRPPGTNQAPPASGSGVGATLGGGGRHHQVIMAYSCFP